MCGKLLKKYLLIFLLGLVFVEVVNAAATKFTDVNCRNLTVTGTLTNSACYTTGNQTVSGNQTVTGSATVTGAGGIGVTYGVAAATGAFTNSTMAVTVSSSTTSSAKLCVGGAFAALPTTGFNAGCLVYDTADQKLYISTETVVGTVSWKSVGSQ